MNDFMIKMLLAHGPIMEIPKPILEKWNRLIDSVRSPEDE